MSRLARAAATACAALAVTAPVSLLAGPAAASPVYGGPVEDYAPYQPQKGCHDTARPGTRELAEWIDARFDAGAAVASMRACDSGGTSEHKAGRAIDWMVDADDDEERKQARAFLTKVFATDGDDNAHALGRRMGIMYVIWNDRMWASYDRFSRKDYLHSACPSVEKCSVTLRHRDHVHISLSRRGARGETSWYLRD